jgi:hypothetical protein
MTNTGVFPNGYHLEPSSNIGGLAEVVHTNPEKQTSFPVQCRDLTGGSKKKKNKKKYRGSKKSRGSKKKTRGSKKKKSRGSKKKKKSRGSNKKSRGSKKSR